ncbi:MAG: ribosome biogenesis GTP-binding protein YihA/YsxC [Actinomycetota bacterium]
MSGPIELTFVTSADRLGTLPQSRAEVAVVGRSNVGKSSLINALANRKNLARVSNTPGRTRLLNLFTLGTDRDSDGALPATVMDLPGYGYAKASKQMRASWGQMIEDYLLEREELVMVVVLVDGEVGPTKLDVQMLDWLRSNNLPHTVVATKHDKVKSSKRQRRKRDVAEGCDLEPGDVVWVSAVKGVGIDRLRGLLLSWLA